MTPITNTDSAMLYIETKLAIGRALHNGSATVSDIDALFEIYAARAEMNGGFKVPPSTPETKADYDYLRDMYKSRIPMWWIDAMETTLGIGM